MMFIRPVAPYESCQYATGWGFASYLFPAQSKCARLWQRLPSITHFRVFDPSTCGRTNPCFSHFSPFAVLLSVTRAPCQPKRPRAICRECAWFLVFCGGIFCACGMCRLVCLLAYRTNEIPDFLAAVRHVC